MPPNVKFHSVHINDNADNDSTQYQQPEFDKNILLSSKEILKKPNDVDGRTLWTQILENKASEEKINSSSELFVSLSSIIRLTDEVRERDWLDRFGARLSNISSELCEGLRKHAPDLNRMATVADFNDNLYYHMQQERGLRHFGDDNINSQNVDELENIIQANEYLGSFLTTKNSLPQPPHVDYPWEVLAKHSEKQNLKLGFFPLTKEGMFLQIWPTVDPAYTDPSIEIEGQIVFIPYGKLLIVPASTIHGGGFRTTPSELCPGGNLRFHLYIATDEATLPVHQTNKYTEPSNKSKELERRYVNSKHMKVLLDNLFV